MKSVHSISETKPPKVSQELNKQLTFAWKYFSEVDSDNASCNLCGKHLSIIYGRSGLLHHLRKVHVAIYTKEANDNQYEPKKSFVWEFFVKVGADEACCNSCGKHVPRRSGTNCLITHLRNVHNIVDQSKNFKIKKEPISETDEGDQGLDQNFVDVNAIEEPQLKNCFICDGSLDEQGKSLGTLTDLSSSPYYQILGEFEINLLTSVIKKITYLESFTGATITDEKKVVSEICLHCSDNLEKFDEYQQHCREIQFRITDLYQKTHSDVAEDLSLASVQLPAEADAIFVPHIAHALPTTQLKTAMKSRKKRTPKFKPYDLKPTEMSSQLNPCGFFENQTDLNKNQVSQHDNNQETRNAWKSNQNLNFHLLTNHGTLEPLFREKCPICTLEFQNIESFREHCLNHQKTYKIFLPSSSNELV